MWGRKKKEKIGGLIPRNVYTAVLRGTQFNDSENAFRSVVHAILFSILDGKQNTSIDYGATACKQSAGGSHTAGKIFVHFGRT